MSVGRPLVFALSLVMLSLTACRARPVAGESTAPRLSVLIVNGGGSKAQNFQSHLLHVRRLLTLLREQRLPPDRIAIFDADGTDPAADMAVRELQPEPQFWLLRGTRLEGPLGTRIEYANTQIATEFPGTSVAAATRENLHAWFGKARKRLRAGDTLLLYVTDHGAKVNAEPEDNRITLWGDKESLTVKELRADLERLDPGVRVVMLMSQCFSGAFANLLSVHARDGVPRGGVCGYFASTADRPAYGCYPENRGKDNVGHSFHFLEALGRTGSLADAHAEVLWTDRTPDVPLRTSDVWLEQVITSAAKAGGVERDALVDELLRDAWRDKATWEPDIRLLDRIGNAFGVFSPRSLAELEDQTKRLQDIADQLKSNGNAWKGALGDLNEANLGRFVAAREDWAPRLAADAVNGLDEAARRALTADLLVALEPFARGDRAGDRRLTLLRDKDDKASPASYRMEVRLAAALRLRNALTSIAGRVFLATRARPAERTAYEALRACEDLHLQPEPAGTPTQIVSEPFPSFDEDVRLARNVLPGWMGINFRQADKKARERLKLAEGAATILTVYPDSPAQAAGLEVGDMVLGPRDRPFTEPRQIREWVMTSPVDRPVPLVVQRGEEQLQVTLVPKPFPIKLPDLPGPPAVGTTAPPLALSSYRGSLPGRLDDGRSHLLFFWATWCAPCKASVPELLAFERERDTQVIAVTDEATELLDGFFSHWKDPFPATVGVDELRRAYQAYAVSGTPTFVLVDGKGLVQSQSTGYTPEKSLGVPEWTWKDAPAAEKP
ncbi:MAG TPA: thioredoxin fold domain-containing protein [Candidatus Binatia bacterium]|nr:thioredoxin fold domain-containing protein [Candidatus Binatia bacterium]